MRTCAFLATLAVAAQAPALPPLQDVPHTHARAGCPQSVAPWAVSGRSDRDALGYVGGGCVGGKGEARDGGEGMIGWDYVGRGWFPGRVFLNWCHCGKAPKAGTYKTDGPHVPDVFSVQPLRQALEKKHDE